MPYFHVGPIFLTCPNCGEEIKLVRRIESGKEFSCPMCAAILRLPRICMQLFLLSMAAFCVGIISTALIGMALNIRTPQEAIFFQSNPIPGIVFWISAILALTLAALSATKMKLLLIRRAPSYSNSNAPIAVDNVQTSLRRRASSSITPRKLVSLIRQVVVPAVPRMASRKKRLGICIVCKKDIRGSDVATWCPHCGRPAHELHLLKYLHTHSQCLACGNHLDETELRHQLSEGRTQQKNVGTEVSTRLRKKGVRSILK